MHKRLSGEFRFQVSYTNKMYCMAKIGMLYEVVEEPACDNSD